MPRTILHLDLDAFFCAVEEQRDPALQGRPFAVGGAADSRGVVSSCSYAARRFGVRSAMPMAQAVRLCPDLVVVPARHNAYSAASRRVMDRLRQLTPLVEQLSIDEAFLDVSELPQLGEALARELQVSIRDDFGLPCSLGVAGNKLVAKIATDIGKTAARNDEARTMNHEQRRLDASGSPFVVHHSSLPDGPPNAICIVQPGQEAAFLAPLPTTALWGVGPKTAARLAELGVHTIGDIARRSEAELGRLFGKHGRDLARRAQGVDDRPVETQREAKSISQETTYARDVRDEARLRTTLRDLAAGVGRRLRRAGLSATTIGIKLRWADFTTVTRQTTLGQPTDQDEVIGVVAAQLFERAWQAGEWVRLLGVSASGLGPAPRQLGLWDAADSEQQRRLQAAVRALRERFGDGVVRWGSEVDGGEAPDDS
jgi:DNA polymerase-4